MVKLRLNPQGTECFFVSEVEGAFVVEPMQFWFPGAARAKAKRLMQQETKRLGAIHRRASVTP